VTHHVYPGVNTIDFNNPKTLDRIKSDISWYVPTIRSLMPKAEIWAGENGPTGGGEDGTCGGHSACGTYATTLWYADELGLRAKSGFVQHQRQDLLGGRYGLLGIEHSNEALGQAASVRLHPDFWVMYMWKRVMGTAVLNATVTADSPNESLLRAYAHCGQAVSPERAGSDSGSAAMISAVLINLSNTSSLFTSVDVTGDSEPHKQTSMTQIWTLTPGEGGVFGLEVMLNDKVLLDRVKDGEIPSHIPIEPKRVPTGQRLELPAVSISFLLIPVVGNGNHLPKECS